MSRAYDNWEKLVEAVVKREELRRIAYCQSLSSSFSSDSTSLLSFRSTLEDIAPATTISSKTFDAAGHSSHHGLRPMRFKEIKKATKNFQPDLWLGQGGFGPVFKGWIDEHTLTASKRRSRIPVAVKKREQGSWQGHEEWLNEINYLSQFRHPNLVRLIGYCSEKDNLILVYEFMPKGCLDNHLFRGRQQSLSWETRIKVAIGVAKALSFLHDLATPVIHRGCQTNNILLDGEFNAKLSDFGFAWDGPIGDMTHVSTRIVGTYGFAAPEYIATGHLTEKCDVFSFGIVLLELLTGRRAYDIMLLMKEQNLEDCAKQYLGGKRKMLQVMDTGLERRYRKDEADTVLKVACQCLSKMPEERPRMADIVAALLNL